MRARWPLLATVLSLGVAYVGYPYVALYRLGSAIKSADTATLEAMVDWPAVREGIKEDVCDRAAENSSPKANADLPPFGESFVRGVTSSSIDQTVTPQALLAVTKSEPVHPTPRGADIHVNWAFFESPTTFMVSLQPPGQTDPIKLEMDLRYGAWRVQRVWLPADLLEAGTRT